MAEIPRKPSFPAHVIQKILARIGQEVEDNVIPVSTGIYTEQKLVNQLQAIPKPVLVDYDDRVFYELTQKQGTCQLSACPVCHHEFNNRRKPVMCHFCTRWSCEECICHRQRLHPLDNNPNGKRYSICYDCDGKYLSLQLSHPYVENRVLIQTAIVEVSKDLEAVEQQLENQKRKIDAVKGEPKRKLNMKVSILKKQDLDLKKNLKKTSWDIENQKDKMSKLRAKLCDTKLKQQKQLQAQEQLRLQREAEQAEQQKRKEEQQRLRRIEQQKRIQEQKQRERIRRQNQQQERIQKERQMERIRKMEIELENQKQKQKRKQKEKQLQQERLKEKERLKQIQKKKKIQEQKQAERLSQLQKQKEEERIRKAEQQRKKKEEQEQERRKESQQRIRRERQDLVDEQRGNEYQDTNSSMKTQTNQSYSSPVQNRKGDHHQQLHDSQREIEFTFDPSKHENTRDTEPESQKSGEQNRSSYLFHQFKNYFTEQIINNAQKPEEPEISMNKMTQVDRPLSHEEKQQLFSQFRRSLEEEEEKAKESPVIESTKMQIMKQANKKRRNWEDMNKEEGQQISVVSPGQKCKCAIF